MMKLNPDDLADNSSEPKVLKLQDMDTWTIEELVDWVQSLVDQEREFIKFEEIYGRKMFSELRHVVNGALK